MKKRCAVRVISFLLAAVIVPVGFLIKEKTKRERYSLQLQYNYMRSLSDLSDSLANIYTELRKSSYVTTAPQFCGIAAEIYRQSGLAQSALAQLPAGEADLSPVFKFVAQAGDYSLTVARQSISGGVTQEVRENLLVLANAAMQLSSGVEEMRMRYEDGQGMQLEVSDEQLGGVSDGLTDIRDSINSYPTLIYDGPYSDHMLEGESKLLSSAQPVDVSQAAKEAAHIIGAQAEDIALSGEDDGPLAAYRFDSGNTAVAVSKRGGRVVYLRNYRATGNQTLTYEQAAEKAARWLSEYSGQNFEQSYYFADEGVCTVNFAYKEGTTVCYTDLIKVGVALDTGEVVLYEANGYLMNHRQRTISTPALSLEQAASSVSDSLEIISSRRVLIPSAGNNELQCYEFYCKDAEQNEVLVYINCDTGLEEQVYMVIKTDGGTLTK